MTILGLSEVTNIDLELLSCVTKETLNASFKEIGLAAPALLVSINNAANRSVGNSPERKADFVAGATAVAGMMIWHSAVIGIDELTYVNTETSEQLQLFY
ncbi:hypothetical protein EBQ81_03820 [bacterium]|jgi:hypothetical protein|nr:hypothetical protein [bacterium]NBX97963.1 hypothetical protein [bacterium]